MELNKELFDDVIVYRISELGAMGPNGTLTCLKKTGELLKFNYLSDETPWNDIKKNFDGINGCIFNGPMPNEKGTSSVIVIGASHNDSKTRVNQGWKHFWLDVGNHLVCKEEYYDELVNIFKDKDNIDITFSWDKMLIDNNFINRLQAIEDEYIRNK